MCGIAGIFELEAKQADVARVRRMNALQAHRGPDGEGLLDLGPLVLGHRRLAVIDLSPRAAQPMRLEREGLAISFNGELYNYRELRAELEGADAVFRSESDTEVVLHAYARWGEEAFARFNGMWALALWEERGQRLLLCRDRFGIKPLYLREEGQQVIFASEAKAVVAAAGEALVDEGVLGRFLLHGVQDDGARTFFRGVRQLLPGRLLVFRRGTPTRAPSREERRYWQLEPVAVQGDPAHALRELLEDAVRLRLRSDVPVGTCLSGGLDSSAIVALASAHLREPVRTFTAIYDEPECDERRFARAVVKRCGCHGMEILPEPGEHLVDLIDTIGWYHDEPCARPGLLAQWHVMSLAAGQVKVLLDGQGGDETLLGYASYALPYLRSLGREALRGGDMRSQLLKLARDGRGLLRAPSVSPEGRASLLRHLARAGLRRLRRQETPALAAGLLAAAAEVGVERTPRGGGVSDIDRLLRDDLAYTSIPALLHHEDRASMAFSLEARVPFLDHRLVELALGLDFRAKVEGGHMKAVLRRAVGDLLPAEVSAREDKAGYPLPLRRWLRASGAEVKEVLLAGFAERGMVDARHVERTWLELERGRGRPWLLYRWLTTELWLRRFIDRPLAPPLRAPGSGLPLPAAASA